MLIPGATGGDLALTVHVSTNQSNVNCHNALVAAGWDGVTKGIFTIVIDSGVLVSATSTAFGALDTGTIPAGSTLKLINNGMIHGRGGDGGKGADAGDGVTGSGTAGSTGGCAINLNFDLTIDNTNGQIFGGGGGAGGGGSDWANDPSKGGSDGWAPGGGGGAGRGGGTGGAAGAANGGGAAGAGGNSSDSAPGGGGAGGTDHSTNGSIATGGTGGTGGDWGAAGASASGGTFPAGNAGGGAGGKAIALNSHTATILAGNDSTHLKGAIV